MLRLGRALLFSFTLVLVPLCGTAGDTIVLKSGRRISAHEVRETGDRVIAEMESGELTFSKAQVARIERAGGRSATVQETLLPAPDLGGMSEGIPFDEIARKVVANGSINRGLLAQIENEARSGSLAATARAAAAHDTIGDFQASRGELAAATESYRRALLFAPRHLGLEIKLAYLMLKKQQYREASRLLEISRREHPRSPEVAALLGWAYYSSEKMGLAIGEWERSLELRRDGNVEAALKKARRETQVDADYHQTDTSRFLLKYNGPAIGEVLAREVLATLEQQYDEISSDLNLQGREPIIVFLYTEEAFQDVTQAPRWAGAINDGKLRIPVQGLSAVTPELRRVLKHELTHVFIAQKTAGRCPVWLNEGLAQWEEGKSLSRLGAALAEQYAADQFIPLRNLEGPFMGMETGQAAPPMPNLWRQWIILCGQMGWETWNGCSSACPERSALKQPCARPCGLTTKNSTKTSKNTSANNSATDSNALRKAFPAVIPRPPQRPRNLLVNRKSPEKSRFLGSAENADPGNDTAEGIFSTLLRPMLP